MIRLKNAQQLEGIRRASRILSTVLDEVIERVAPGVSGLDLDRYAYERITEMGGRPSFLGYMDFPASLCVSVDRAVIHGIPDRTKLRAGQVVGIDCGVEIDGFYSDSAVTVPVGAVSEEIRKLLAVTEESLYLGIAEAKAGNRIHDVSRAVYRRTKSEGYGVVRPYCGHGVGLEIHEDPQVPNYVGKGPNPRLKPGMVIAIEPMINLGGDDVRVLDDDWTVVTSDGSVSAHFEHTVAILEDRTEILTLRPGSTHGLRTEAV